MLFHIPIIDNEGDRNTITKLYQHYENSMYNIAYSILNDRFLSEDAVNEAFIKLIKYLPEIKEIECHKTKTLIVIIVKSTAIDIYRKRKRQYKYEIEEQEEENDTDVTFLDQIIADENYNELLLKLKDIKKEYKEIILLKYVYELSNKEISTLLGVTEIVVRQHICRAKKAIKKLTEEK